MDTHNEKLKFQMEPWMECRPVVADSHHIDEEPDPDPHQSENPDPHQSEMRPDPHLSDADPRPCL